ncbi:MAG: phage minor head protein [Alphaproteobacteria bacterium]
MTGISTAITHALRMGPTTDLETAKTVARAAVSGNVTFADQAKATDILKEFYTQAGKVGAEAAGEQINADPIANLPSVKELLDKAHLTIKNITDTQMDQISTAVKDGLMNGSPASVISDQINAGLLDASRADLIAVTEGNRAYNAATTDSFQAAGISQFNWNAYDDACPECLDLEAGSPYEVSDDTPPDHPNCRCFQTAVIA